MKLFSFFKKNKDEKKEAVSSVVTPWSDFPSIYGDIAKCIKDNGRLNQEYELPDEERLFEGQEIRFAPGAMDGILSHHVMDGEEGKEKVQQTVELLKAINTKNQLADKIALYNLLMEESTLNLVDPVLDGLVEAEIYVQDALLRFSRWLAFESPDRSPVKFGIALVGLLRDEARMNKVIQLGKHEEFTLFSAVALRNTFPNAYESHLWELAKVVDGWGRIHLVEQIANTENTTIKDWLLREGFRNNIHYGYLAYTCAMAGDLEGALAAEEIDQELLVATADILDALIEGGPAENMYSYGKTGPLVAEHFVHHANMRDKEVLIVPALGALKDFLEQIEEEWEDCEDYGWTKELRGNLLIDIHKYLTYDDWDSLVRAGIGQEDEEKVWLYYQAAKVLEVDLWEVQWAKVQAAPTKPGHWYYAIEHVNEERIDTLLAFAQKIVAEEEMGEEEKLSFFQLQSSVLVTVLRVLYKYPHKGEALLLKGLGLKDHGTKTMCIQILSKWERSQWSSALEAALDAAILAAEDAELKERMEELKRGEMPDFGVEY